MLEIDYVRETTRVAVRYVAGARTPPVSQEALDAVHAR